MGCRKPPPSSPARREPPYLRSIWLQAAGSGETGRLTLMATDVNIEFTGTYPAEVREEGQAGVNGRAFVELLAPSSRRGYPAQTGPRKATRFLSNRDAVPTSCPRRIPSGSRRCRPSRRKEPCCGQETSFRTLSTVFPSASAMTTAPKHSPASASRVWSRARWTSAA